MAAFVAKILFLSVLATIFACIEIESEGKNGWAHAMPTWYRTSGFWGRAYMMLMGGKPLTGYHTFMFFLPLMMFHIQFFTGAEWSIVAELEAWALFFLWCPFWDYFWFVLNPAFIGKFKREHIWWHHKNPWVFGLFPSDYLMGALISIGFAFTATWLSGTNASIKNHLGLIIGMVLYTFALQLAAPAYHRWYARMRKSDDRDQTKTF